MTNTWTTYRDIDRYIHRYSDCLVVMISVGLASARPNYVHVVYAYVLLL